MPHTGDENPSTARTNPSAAVTNRPVARSNGQRRTRPPAADGTCSAVTNVEPVWSNDNVDRQGRVPVAVVHAPPPGYQYAPTCGIA
ncbi:hypothetical protein [Amycolatopsis sp. CA-126428]|uniref:hypothetical protein n=1 Tax=Amycolatopsis sp. CA-126428 TaxID=2073158 RepID=UPI001E576ED8|nr:hypothetical protein [Amycolatopsis sp. CA-126428]